MNPNKSLTDIYQKEVERLKEANRLSLKTAVEGILDKYPEIINFEFSFGLSQSREFHIMGINEESFFFSLNVKEKYSLTRLEKAFEVNAQKENFKIFLVESNLTKEKLFDFCHDLFELYNLASWTDSYLLAELIMELRPGSRYLEF